MNDEPALHVQQDDEVLITGVASSPHGMRLYQAQCVVAAVTADAIKVWPLGEIGEKEPKVWLMRDQIESIERVQQGS